MKAMNFFGLAFGAALIMQTAACTPRGQDSQDRRESTGMEEQRGLDTQRDEALPQQQETLMPQSNTDSAAPAQPESRPDQGL